MPFGPGLRAVMANVSRMTLRAARDSKRVKGMTLASTGAAETAKTTILMMRDSRSRKAGRE